MTHADVQDWLNRYVAAWRASDATLIGDLFAEDATYGYRPRHDEGHSVRGRDRIVAGWLEEPDDPETWDAGYEPFVVDGSSAVAVGWTRYAPTADKPEASYDNAFLLTFDPDGRCTDFREFYMLRG